MHRAIILLFLSVLQTLAGNWYVDNAATVGIAAQFD